MIILLLFHYLNFFLLYYISIMKLKIFIKTIKNDTFSLF